MAAFGTGSGRTTLLTVGTAPTEIKVTARHKQLSSKETWHDRSYWTEKFLLLSLYKRNPRQDTGHLKYLQTTARALYTTVAQTDPVECKMPNLMVFFPNP